MTNKSYYEEYCAEEKARKNAESWARFFMGTTALLLMLFIPLLISYCSHSNNESTSSSTNIACTEGDITNDVPNAET